MVGNRKNLDNVESLLNEVIKNNRTFKRFSLTDNLTLPKEIKEIKAILKELNNPKLKLTDEERSAKIEKIIDAIGQRFNKEDSKKEPLFNEFCHGVIEYLANTKPLPTMTELNNNKRDLNALNQFLKKVPDTEGIIKIKSILNNSLISYQDKISAIKDMKFPIENDKKEGNKFCRLLANFLDVKSQLKGGTLGNNINNSDLYKELNKEKNRLEAQGLKTILKEIEPSERPSMTKRK